MLFAFRIAKRYLFPRLKQLSSSLISLLSLLVISLVVWLVLVFTSVTDGLEARWIDKLIAISAPIRLQPTKSYFDSYYYQVDRFSQASDFQAKTFEEKLKSSQTDPYNSLEDPPLPDELLHDRKDLDIIKETFAVFQQLNLPATPFYLAPAQFSIRFDNDRLASGVAYLSTLSIDHPALAHLGLNHSQVDLLKGPQLFLPKVFKDSGVKLGDEGVLTYFGTSLASTQEQHLSFFVAGFFDPGIIPVGGKLFFASQETIDTIRSSSQLQDEPASCGIHLWCTPKEAKRVKKRLQASLQNAQLDSYWQVESFDQYEFSKDLLQQLSSDKLLFSLLALIILLVACSNIISMLILLVNDKKHDIGVLRALGASSRQIIAIFCTCGFTLGLLSALLGTLAAIWTLSHLDLLVSFLSQIQGHDAFNALFFGDQLPNSLSTRALVMVWIASGLLSLLAGAIPAWKACTIRPAQILRSE